LTELAATDVLWGSERERIIEATAALCAVRGYAELTVAEVIERASVSEENFVSIFPGGKEEAMVAAVNTVLAETVSAVSGAYSHDRSEAESALIGVRGILELMAAKPSHAYVSFISARQAGPPSVTAVHDTGIRTLSVMLERLWEYSNVKVQPPRIPAAVVGGAEAVVRRELVAGRHEDLPRLLPDFIFGATVAFLGREEALRMARLGRELLAGTRWAEG
jgi:AcrR family transcriptional regulator